MHARLRHSALEAELDPFKVHVHGRAHPSESVALPGMAGRRGNACPSRLPLSPLTDEARIVDFRFSPNPDIGRADWFAATLAASCVVCYGLICAQRGRAPRRRAK
jgi:hypothetical protein